MSTNCGICGESHYYRDCKLLSITCKISNKIIPTNARLSLPDELDLIKFADESYSIVTKQLIKLGTEFGPFIAKRSLTMNPDSNFPLKIFIESEYESSEYYLDAMDENECCWMMFVNAAKFAEEQNLICYQEKEDIYFCATRDIRISEKLKVWYSFYYGTKMQKNMLDFKSTPDLAVEHDQSSEIDLNKLVENQQNIVPRKVWSCKFCYKMVSGLINFANHLSIHYKQKQSRTSTNDQQTFLYSKKVKNHLTLYHNEDLGKNQSQTHSSPLPQVFSSLTLQRKKTQENNRNSIGGPLLVLHNDLSDSSTDTSNNSLFLQQKLTLNLNMNMVDTSCRFDHDNLNLYVDDAILTNRNFDEIKDLNYMNAKDLHQPKEEVVCDICLKTFPSFKAITLHLNFHMGKYFCNSCKKVFARSENLKSHKCNINLRYRCDKCYKLFSLKKYLFQHISIVHDKKFSCGKCNKWFFSASDLNSHVCNKTPFGKRSKYPCDKCHKIFLRKTYLKNHSKIHLPKPNKEDSFICSICSKIFATKRIYDRHVGVVHERKKIYDCRICDKVFNRSDILKCHMINIHNLGIKAKYECSACGKNFKSRKNLSTHSVIHDSAGFECFCGSVFKQKCNLTRHAKQFHKTEVESQSLSKKTSLLYECPICHNKMKLKRSLTRHIRTKHPEKFKSICLLEMSRRKMKMEHENGGKLGESIGGDEISTEDDLADLQATIENMDFDMENLFTNTDTVDRILKESSDAIGNFFGDEFDSTPSSLTPLTSNEKTDDISFNDGNSNNCNNKVVCLSMPNLDELEHDIKLGKNSFTLENENIVEQDSSNIIIYVLNE